MNFITDKFGTSSCSGVWGTFDRYQVLIFWICSLVDLVFQVLWPESITCHYLSVYVFCSPHSVHRAHAGESERILREAFSEASSHVALGKPSVIFIDEIDALCARRDSKYDTVDDSYAKHTSVICLSFCFSILYFFNK